MFSSSVFRFFLQITFQIILLAFVPGLIIIFSRRQCTLLLIMMEEIPARLCSTM